MSGMFVAGKLLHTCIDVSACTIVTNITTTVATLVYTCKRDTSWQWSDHSPRTRGRVEVEEDCRSELFIERDARCLESRLATHIRWKKSRLTEDRGKSRRQWQQLVRYNGFTVTLIACAVFSSTYVRHNEAKPVENCVAILNCTPANAGGRWRLGRVVT